LILFLSLHQLNILMEMSICKLKISSGVGIGYIDLPRRKEIQANIERLSNTGQFWVDNSLFFVKIIMRTFLGVK
jgi:hypothetical protein